MIIEFIGFNVVNFDNDKKEHIEGVNAWYLAKGTTDNYIGTIPRKKWFNKDYIPLFRSSGAGAYEVETDLSGRVTSIRKVNK